jgi:alkylation response protein AidB-like acyl-CoA dehydrogenase
MMSGDLHNMAAERLEKFLGDPFCSDNSFTFLRAVEYDERDEYPEQFCNLLNDWQLADYYIPGHCGGQLTNYGELISLLRVVARRDLTTVIAHAKTFLGGAPVWVGGESEQQRRLAQKIKSRDQISLALTERNHGSDLLAGELRATPTSHGYCLSGEKWLINNATRGAALSVLARTDTRQGPRSFSVFFVEKEELDATRFRPLAAVKTYGIRGADISGLGFDNCVVPAASLVGQLGSGLEIMLKSLQLTRTIVPALSLGAADTALRTTLRFLRSRRLYGKNALDMPYIQTQLVDAFIDLLICECVSVSAARSIHVIPDQMSVLSAIAKYFVPTVVDNSLKNMAVLLGARHYLRQEHDAGIYQKILRDHSIVGIFDGNTALNLDAISLQLRHLSAEITRNKSEKTEQSKRLEAIFNLTEILPDFDVTRLALLNRGRNDVMQGLALMRDALVDCNARSESDTGSEIMAAILPAIERVIVKIKKCDHRVVELSGRDAEPGVSVEMMELARQYCFAHASAACLQMWWYNRSSLGDFVGRGEWLVLALDRLERELNPGIYACSNDLVTRVSQSLIELHDNDRMFSIMPIQLARSGQLASQFQATSVVSCPKKVSCI